MLPTTLGTQTLVDVAACRATEAAARDEMVLGLFLANPFLNVDRVAKQLWDAGWRWIANLPGVDQQDPEFSKELTDVHLDLARELEMLGRFRRFGFRVASVIAAPESAPAAAALEPDLVIVLPRVADFAAGFPSSRQRGAVATAVVGTLRDLSWEGTVLILATEAEAAHPALWPDAADGLLLRPAVSLAGITDPGRTS